MHVARTLVLAAICGISASCAVGSGTGSVSGALDVPGCDADLTHYDMQADFFAANAYNPTPTISPPHYQLTITIQHGGGSPEYADSLMIVVQDTELIEQAIEKNGGPVEFDNIGGFERPPGSPVNVPPPLIRLTLNLRGTCGTQVLNPLGDPTQVVLEATGGKVTFSSILHDDIQSSDSNSKRIEGTFDVDVTDPRGAGFGLGSKGHISGDFKLFYQRGGPAQPFP